LKKNGFTLLELALSLTITGIILIIILSALRLGIDSWERGERNIRKMENFSIAIYRISEDIKSIYPYTMDINQSGYKRLQFIGKEDSISFVTISPNGFRWVEYYVNNIQDSHYKGLLERSGNLPDSKVFDSSSGAVIEMDPNVVGIEFEYLDIVNSEERWAKEWNKNINKLPKAIRIKIIYNYGLIYETTIPINVNTRI
jgi:prepilin-type N-terminal cleavage/methylation domain-containing protein